MSWTTDVPIKMDDQRPGTPEIRNLSLSPAEPGNPGAAAVVLGVRHTDESWHDVVHVPPLRLVDEVFVATEEEPAPPPTLPQNATDFINAIMTAKIDGTNPLAQKFSIPDGTLLGDALPQIAWGFLYPAAKITKTTKKGK